MNWQATAVETDEAEWITRAQRGDREAFGELVRIHRAGTINVVYRMCGDPALAEDAAQEAFIRAWQHLPAYQPKAAFRSWLYRIAINAGLDLVRHSAARPETTPGDEALEWVPAAGSVERGVEQRERIERVRQAVLALPEASRAVLVLREYEGMSYEEIAAALEIPTGTVMSRLSYARKSLAERLKTMAEEV
jgi:RNA polymerase sigma-70 factor (ECF subfamily)